MEQSAAETPLAVNPIDWQPQPVQSLEDTGLSMGFLSDMALKIMYFQGQITGYDIAEKVHLPFANIIALVMEFLKREQMCEVKGSAGLGAGAYEYTITAKGSARAREQLERTAYIGPAPVPWSDYVDAMRLQGSGRLQVQPDVLAETLSHLVLADEILDKIGPAVNSGKSIFLYGPPGNGKTTIAESVGRMVLREAMYVPYAVEVDGQIIKIFDGINHEIVPQEAKRSGTGSLAARPDARWVLIRRPVVMVGGELTLDGLELSYDPTNKYYEAPFQMKANGGMFLIDDFGRQQIRPRDLLNRWIVPMEKQVDFLALHTGRKIEMPFEVLIVFSTNLPPRDLVDEAFLRRIRHKIEITSPDFDAYRSIFLRVCQDYGIPFREEGIRYLLKEHYVRRKRRLRANHPRDLVEQMIDIASYLGIKPEMSQDLIDRAAASYFVDL